jgi:hypothetical protein
VVNNSRAQNDSVFHFIRSVKGNFSFFNVDNLNNIYLVTNNNQLKKLDDNGDSVGVFNDVKRYGNPSSIDVTNPLKVLLYYQPYSTVVVLDRQLNIRNTINFRKQGIFSVHVIATSYDNNIWLFDEQDFKLKKINEEGILQQETNDMRMTFDSVPSAAKLVDRDNYVYLYDAEKGFYIFDYYGGYKNRLTFLHWSDIEVSGNRIYGFADNKLYSYELRSLALKEYKLPSYFGEYIAIKAMNGKVYLLNDKGIDIYEVK